MKRYDQVEKDFEKALTALQTAILQAQSDLEVDGVIQRFEFVYELFWKLLRLALQQDGILANTPRECFKEAFRTGLLSNEQATLKLIDDRNLTVHLYDRDVSRQVYERIKTLYEKLFSDCLDVIKKR